MYQEPVKTRLGDILVKKGLISDEQLQSAIGAQKSSHLQLGEILIEMQCVTQRQINRALKVQSKLRNAVLTSILSLSPLALVGCGSGGSGGEDAAETNKPSVEQVAESAQANSDSGPEISDSPTENVIVMPEQQTQPPEAAQEVAEEAVEDTESAIRGAAKLSWSFPSQRVDESDLELHEIERFRIYQVFGNGDFDTMHEVDGSDTTYTIENLAQGDYHFAITVVDSDGHESGFSETISLSI